MTGTVSAKEKTGNKSALGPTDLSPSEYGTHTIFASPFLKPLHTRTRTQTHVCTHLHICTLPQRALLRDSSWRKDLPWIV